MASSFNQPMTAERITYLFERYMAGTSTGPEELELSELALMPKHEAVFEELERQYWDSEESVLMPEEEIEQHVNRILIKQPAKLRTLNLKKWLVAASVLFIIGIGVYYWLLDNTKSQIDIPITSKSDVEAPKGTRAMITLASGQQVYLDSMQSGTITEQGNVAIMKFADGQIAYETTSTEKPGELRYNTLTNPRGSSVIDMRLQDGSHVWLNAGSSITYPVAFVGNERNVSITGEAYFEVAKDPMRKFIVVSGGITTEVLGTHFNVNAYDDEEFARVTLLEGRVRVGLTPSAFGGEGSDRSIILKPGEQAVAKVSPSGGDLGGASPDLEEVMAWKNGLFRFNQASLAVIMRQLERWYDVEVKYQGNTNGLTFYGGVGRKENISEVLKILELTNAVTFDIKGRTITATAK